MIRYLAFNNQLPLVDGLIRRTGSTTQVLSSGRWVSGAAWTPPAATPASPGWVAEGSAFASAASTVLAKLTGHAFAADVAQRGARRRLAGHPDPGGRSRRPNARREGRQARAREALSRIIARVFHITGPSGSGKSTLGRELARRGHAFIETDFASGLACCGQPSVRREGRARAAVQHRLACRSCLALGPRSARTADRRCGI